MSTTLAVYGHLFDGVDDRLDDMLETTRAQNGGAHGRALQAASSSDDAGA